MEMILSRCWPRGCVDACVTYVELTGVMAGRRDHRRNTAGQTGRQSGSLWEGSGSFRYEAPRVLRGEERRPAAGIELKYGKDLICAPNNHDKISPVY